MEQAPGFPDLFTTRLALRKLKTEDDQALLTLRSDDIVNRYLDRPKATTLLQVREFINKINMAVDKNESYYWAITLPDSGRLIGTICFWNISEDRAEVEIGYELDPAFHGKGLMQESISKVIDFGFHSAGFKIIIAYPHKDNASSIKLLERNHFKIDKNLTNKNRSDKEFDKLLSYSLSKNS